MKIALWEKLSLTNGLILLSFFWGLSLYLLGGHLTGPFIFGDEETYFSFARTIAKWENINAYTQYGPLYPTIIAPFFLLKNIIQSYSAIKIFNVLIFLSAALPAYLLAKDLFKNHLLKGLLPILITISPYGAFAYLIWAEPLYISLFYWVCFLLYRHSESPSFKNSLFLGIFLSSLYLTKPIAGLVAFTAIIITFFLPLLFNATRYRKEIKVYAILAVSICFLIDFIWILHYLNLGVSILGYPTAHRELQLKLEKLGYWHLTFNIIKSIFYQFSYFFIGSWGLISVLLMIFVTQWRHLTFSERNLTLFILLYMVGVILIAAIGMSSYSGLDHKMAQGRYYSLLLPLIITLTLHFIFAFSSNKTFRIKPFLAILAVTTLIAIIASPFYTRSPVTYTSMPELTPFIYISDKGLSIWRATIEKPSMSLRIYSVVFFTVFISLLYYLRKWKYMPFLATSFILVGTLFNSVTEQYYLLMMGKTQVGLNNIYRYLIKNHINISNVVFDTRMNPGNPEFMTPFWLESTANYADAKKFKTNTVISSYFVTWDTLDRNYIYSSKGVYLYNMRSYNDFKNIS